MEAAREKVEKVLAVEQQKLEVIKQLARAGADITELNTVRSVQSE